MLRACRRTSALTLGGVSECCALNVDGHRRCSRTMPSLPGNTCLSWRTAVRRLGSELWVESRKRWESLCTRSSGTFEPRLGCTGFASPRAVGLSAAALDPRAYGAIHPRITRAERADSAPNASFAPCLHLPVSALDLIADLEICLCQYPRVLRLALDARFTLPIHSPTAYSVSGLSTCRWGPWASPPRFPAPSAFAPRS